MHTVLIVGGSRGIGAELCRAFTAAGYQVAFTYCRSKREADALAVETGALAVRADSKDKKAIENAVKITAEAFGAPDILVNNAAVSYTGLFTDIKDSEWEETIAVNLTAPFLYTRAVLPHMIQNKWGRIINILSIWGETGAACEVHYSASKAGLMGMTKALAKELGPSGITVNGVSPGLISTEMNQNFSAEDLNAFVEETPVCRMGTPRDISRAVLFLASNDASFITGEILRVNGGYLI